MCRDPRERAYLVDIPGSVVASPDGGKAVAHTGAASFEVPSRGRIARLIADSSETLELDLRGATVVTEAATRVFACTAVLAARAGAEVHAIADDSVYGTAVEAIADVRALATAAGAPTESIAFHRARATLPHGVDLITNSGFVRPVDAPLLELLGPHGVVSLMYEAWEARSEDIDLAACRRLGVAVGGVNEDYEGLAVFSSCGALAVKLLLEAGLEVAGNQIVLISPDRFGDVIEPVLRAAHSSVLRIPSGDELTASLVSSADAVLVAHYEAEEPVVTAALSAKELAATRPGLRIVQMVGPSDVDALEAAGLIVHPRRRMGRRHMSVTLAHLGPRPVVYLHAAGLKVGELLWRQRAFGASPGRFGRLLQEIVPGE